MANSLLLPLSLPSWTGKLAALSRSKRESAILRDGIATLSKHRPKKFPKQTLIEQPFDSLLLQLSPLFRLSRKTYLAQGGTFSPTLLSSARSLSSASLLDQRIQYSPIERELIWAATDPIESKNLKLPRVYETRAYSTSVFHEQSHRILWHLLPPPPPLKKKSGDVFRYLNFVESLVISLDMALGDELGVDLSRILYLSGVIYDPGTHLRRERIARRNYRNYLHACLYATYLTLQLYEPDEIQQIVTQLYPFNSLLTKRAIERASRLDQAFVRITNLDWQEKNEATVVKRLTRKNSAPLELPRDPLDNRLAYIWAEKWFEKMGI
jgi:hypothetical protein